MAAGLMMALIWASSPGVGRAEIPEFPGDAAVFVLPVEGEVEEGLYHVVAHALRQAEEGGFKVFILDMDTPGGRVDSMDKMCTALLEAPMFTMTFVNSRATSAGSLLALSTKRIFMKRGATIGSAAPILMGGDMGDLDEITREKIVGHVRAIARAAAEANGYPPDVAEAFVSAATDIPEIDGTGTLIEKGKPLALSAERAVKYGIATAVVGSLDEILKDHLGISEARITRYEETFFQRVARFLASYSVSYLLLVGALILAYLEFKTPGFGLFGLLSGLAFALYFWGSSIAGLAGLEAFFLFIMVLVGFLLLGVEVFVLPGFGIFGVAGVAMVMMGLTLGMARIPIPEITANPLVLVKPAAVVGSAVVVSFVVLALIVIFLPETSLWNRIALAPGGGRAAPPDSATTGSLTSLAIGDRGVAISDLRPAGIAVFGNRRVSVTSDGDFISSGTAVRVVRLSMHDVYVRRV